MKVTIFYSWQSDLPNATNRRFIESALENAIRGLKREGDVYIDAAIDRDTEGVPGAPDIAETILAKIDGAQIFLADVSLVNYEVGRDSKLRSTPNPNVLVELGYARRALGHSQLLLVHNKAYGPVEHLPFHLRGCRVITYSVEAKEEDKSVPRKNLESRLRVELKKIFDELLRYGLSDDAIRIGKGIASTSEDGLCEDGFMTVEQVSECSGVGLERIKGPLEELQSEGLVDIEGVITSFKDHIIRPTIQLFVRFDPQAKGWDVLKDAYQLACELDSGLWDGYSEGVEHHALRLGWEPRRMNPALAYLDRGGLLKKSEEVPGSWYATAVWPFPTLKAWVKRGGELR